VGIRNHFMQANDFESQYSMIGTYFNGSYGYW